MSNPGNSGKRYKLQTVTACAINPHTGGFIISLGCGHTVWTGGPMYGGSYAAEQAQEKVGKRMACYACVPVHLAS